MSSDPLPWLERPAAPSDDADYEFVYAQIAATERGCRFLAEHVRRSRRADAHEIIRTIARLRASPRDDATLQMPAALARGLTDSAATIERIKSALAASERLPPDVHFAAERIGDVARALRRRDVETALCDSLEAVARDIGDAIVRQHAASARTSSADHLLRDLSRLTRDMTALVNAVTLATAQAVDTSSAHCRASSLNDSACEPADAAAPTSSRTRRFDNTVHAAAADSAAPPLRNETERSPKANSDRLPRLLPEIKAGGSARGNANHDRAPPSPPIPSPLDGETKNNLVSVAPPQQLANDAGAVAHPMLCDSLAALHALSEEELIALFG